MSERSVEHSELLTHTSDIVLTHILRNTVPIAELPGLIETVFDTLSGLGTPAARIEANQKPAISDAPNLLRFKGGLDNPGSDDQKLLNLLRGLRQELEQHDDTEISDRHAND